ETADAAGDSLEIPAATYGSVLPEASAMAAESTNRCRRQYERRGRRRRDGQVAAERAGARAGRGGGVPAHVEQNPCPGADQGREGRKGRDDADGAGDEPSRARRSAPAHQSAAARRWGFRQLSARRLCASTQLLRG